MNGKVLRWGRVVRASVASAVVVGVVGAAGCLTRPIEPQDTRTTATIVERLTQSSVDKIDILLAIDNSRSMADKQQILVDAVPKLVGRLINPLCVQTDMNGVVTGLQPTQPTDPSAMCDMGYQREFKPIRNIHIGVSDSSIGNHAGLPSPEPCADSFVDQSCMLPEQFTNNDHGHLVARGDPYMNDNLVGSTYNNERFLAWDPDQKLVPPGSTDPVALETTLGELVKGVGQVGCGYESQLESAYRFLVDPHPYKSISVDGSGHAVPSTDDDTELLKERADFLRPDSLLAVIMLTDENDCSTKEYGIYWNMVKTANGARLPIPTAACANDPNDPCCYSCGQTAPPQGCSAAPECMGGGSAAPKLDATSDPINLRCWDQKRRFGIDFLYPLDRYVNGFTQYKVADRAGNLVDNPVFTDLNKSDTDSNIRDPGLVFFAGIVGVPWQDVARDKTDISKGFKNSDEMLADVGGGKNTWDVILGTPGYTLEPGGNGYVQCSTPGADPCTTKIDYVAPLDPLMVESQAPRSGTNPITGDAIAPPGSAPGTNPINGHEWNIDPMATNGDLQYACIFPLQTARSCLTNCSFPSCDCLTETTGTPNNPLCASDPGNGGKNTLQVDAKAYPGTRELGVVRYMGAQGIVASVCPATIDMGAPENAYGYNPAVGSIIDRLKVALGGQCLPRTLKPDTQGHVSCLIIEAKVDPKGQEQCLAADARQPVSAEHQPAVTAIKQDPANPGWNSFCEIIQLSGMDLKTCEDSWLGTGNETTTNPATNGWCYVDATTQPPIGNSDIVASCPETERRLVRFVGTGVPQPGATVFITCAGEF